MNQEDIICNKLVKSINNLKKRQKYKKIAIEAKKQVLIGMTCGHLKGDIRFILQSAQQDIVIYLKHPLEFKTTDNDFFYKFSKKFPDDIVIIPIIVFEVKYKSVITHSIRQYSEEARLIKQIFPFIQYNLLLLDMNLDKDVDKIYMAGKHFDKVIYKPNLRRTYNVIVNELWEEIESHIHYLKTNDYFRLSNYL